MVRDPYELLVAACESHGLTAVRYIQPPRVRVSQPGAPTRLAEEVTLSQDGAAFLFSWGEPIGPTNKLADVARRLKHVVSVVQP